VRESWFRQVAGLLFSSAGIGKQVLPRSSEEARASISNAQRKRWARWEAIREAKATQ
jgi:hypothetical protein